MFQDLEVRRFRLFEHLKMERLGRINLLAGRNNSGKTSLLEALFLLCGAGNPEVSLKINGFRGFGELPTHVVVREILMRPLFYKFNLNEEIQISSQHHRLGSMRLTIKIDSNSTVIQPLPGHHLDENPNERQSLIWVPPNTPVSSLDNTWSNDLRLLHVIESGGATHEGYIHSSNAGIQVVVPTQRHNPYLAIFLSARSNHPSGNATRLGDLRRRKQGDLLVTALRIIEPRLQALEENSVAGYPMIWGDIGLSQLVPLSMMGDGMNRIASILLAIFTAANGVVLVDEIENGIHYSVLEKVWRAIADAAERANTQVFATTHSFECMEAAHKALDDKLLFHRIEQEQGSSRCVTFETEDVAAAIHHGLEVR